MSKNTWELPLNRNISITKIEKLGIMWQKNKSMNLAKHSMPTLRTRHLWILSVKNTFQYQSGPISIEVWYPALNAVVPVVVSKRDNQLRSNLAWFRWGWVDLSPRWSNPLITNISLNSALSTRRLKTFLTLFLKLLKTLVSGLSGLTAQETRKFSRKLLQCFSKGREF